jgi:hypothetical protein
MSGGEEVRKRLRRRKGPMCSRELGDDDICEEWMNLV